MSEKKKPYEIVALNSSIQVSDNAIDVPKVNSAGLINISDCPTLRTLKNKFGEKTLKATLIIRVSKHVEFFNVKRPMSANQIMQFIEDLLEDCPAVSLQDIDRAFRKLRKGEVGIYESLDQPKIEEALRLVEEEKAELRERNHKKAISEVPEDETEELTKQELKIKRTIEFEKMYYKSYDTAKLLQRIRFTKENPLYSDLKKMYSEEARKRVIQNFRNRKEAYQKIEAVKNSELHPLAKKTAIAKIRIPKLF